MGVTISDQAIILSDYDNLIPQISGILAKINIGICSDNNSLSSLLKLKNKFNKEGNLSFLKKDILSFIETNGYPFIIIIDMKINTGADSDHDNIKILKTIILSYLIIMQGEQYKNISCNLLILTNNKDYNHLKTIHKHPQNMLSMLKTNDERINNIIHEYTVNDEKFKRNFNILFTDAEEDPSLIKSEAVLFTNMIRSKEKLKNKITQGKNESMAGPKIHAADSADVVLRVGKVIFKNGESQTDYNEELNLDENEVYILGNFTSYTRLEVIEKLLHLIKKGFGNELNFKKGDSLIVNIPEGSIIDSTTSITLAQIISKELAEYKNIKIKTTPLHYQMMQQSHGFSMIQRSVSVDEE